MRLKPLLNRVLLELDDGPATFAGGELLIARVPDQEGYYRHFPKMGTVLEIGPDVQDLKIGDRVVCDKYNAVELSPRDFGGRKLALIREHFVLLVLDKEMVDINFGKAWGDDSPRKR